MHGHFKSFSEQGGGNAALHFDRQRYDAWNVSVGWQISHRIDTPRAFLIPHLRIGYQYSEFNDLDGVGVSLRNSPYHVVTGNRRGHHSDSFEVNSIRRSDREFKASSSSNHDRFEHAAVIGIETANLFHTSLSLALDCEAQLYQNGLNIHQAAVRLSWSF